MRRIGYILRMLTPKPSTRKRKPWQRACDDNPVAKRPTPRRFKPRGSW